MERVYETACSRADELISAHKMMLLATTAGRVEWSGRSLGEISGLCDSLSRAGVLTDGRGSLLIKTGTVVRERGVCGGQNSRCG
jgi:hypothetical protein